LIITAGTGADGDVSLSASSGAILDANGATLNVTADVLTVSASTGIALDTQANSISAQTIGFGGIKINESDAVTLTSVITCDGSIEIDAGGTIVATLVTAGGSGNDVRLTTTGGGDIELWAVTAADDTVLLQAAGAITDGNDTSEVTNNVIASRLAMTAGAGIGSGNAIETSVSTLAGRLSAATIFTCAPATIC
jgi:hypothetical protein